jgi:hypothetical protein
MEFQHMVKLRCSIGASRTVVGAQLLIAWLAVGAGEVVADVITLDVTADIDGRDDLIIVGNTLTWQHWDFTPVGLHNSAYPSTILTTTLNGVTDLSGFAWTPTWPGGTGSGAFSSTFTGVIPAIPMQDMTVRSRSSRPATRSR